MIRRWSNLSGLFAALLAVIFAIGTVTASFACSRDVAAGVAISPPVDDCEHGSPETSCYRSCVAFCHGLTPSAPDLDRVDRAVSVRTALPASILLGLSSGPEPPPPRGV